MTDPSIRPVTAEEFAAFFHVAERPYAGDLRDDDVEAARALLPLSRTLGAFDGDRIVGTAAARDFEVSVPGGSTPMAGVTAVAVLPTDRRRGIVRALMTRQLGDLHDHGEAIAGLWASESGIYRRFGYGHAASSTEITIDTGATGFLRAPRPAVIRLVDVEEALRRFPEIYDRARGDRPGMPTRSEAAWRLWLGRDPEHQRDGMTARELVAIGDRGYAVYRLKAGSWKGWVPDNELAVEELVADDTDTEAALWRFLFDMDLVVRIRASGRPVDDALPYLLADPRRLRRLVHDSLWIRLVRLDDALAARRYARDATIVLRVRDEACPWNAGTWRLEATTEGGAVHRTDAQPHLTLDVADLGSLFLGGERATRLERAGRVVEHAAGALAAVDIAFGVDPAPWCPFLF